jgi:hypothetical protein
LNYNLINYLKKLGSSVVEFLVDVSIGLQSIQINHKFPLLNKEIVVELLEQFQLEGIDFYLGNSTYFSIVLIFVEEIICKFSCNHDSTDQQPIFHYISTYERNNN